MAGDTTASLNTLPTELHIQIAQLLSNQQLLLLRRASKDFAANSIDTFGERFFQRRSHLYTTHSLTALRDISAKPVFARHIKQVEFVVITVEDDEDLQYEEIYWGDFEIVEAAHKAEDWYYQEDKEMRRCHMQLVKEIFVNLAKLGVGRDVKVTTNLWVEELGEHSEKADERIHCYPHDWEAHGGVHGVRHFLDKVNWWVWRADLRDGDIDIAANAVCVALAESRHAVESLDLGYRSHTALTRFFCPWFYLSETTTQNLLDIFSGLTTLKVGFEETEACWSIDRILEAAVNLKEVAIDLCDTWGLREIIPYYLDPKRINRLSLSCMAGDAVDIQDFLEWFKEKCTLQELELSDIEVEPREWNDLCQWMADELDLKEISLIDLREDDRSSLFQDEEYNANFHFAGEEVAKVGLERLSAHGSCVGWARAKSLGRESIIGEKEEEIVWAHTR